jgi:hypothetical protein
VAKRVAAESIAREGLENLLVHLRRDPDSAQHRFLVRLVGDAKARLEIDSLAEFAEQLGAKGVDGSPLYPIDAVSQLRLETLGYFACCLVGEGENANPGWIDVQPLDEIADAFYQAESLSRARPGEDKQRLRRRFDCGAL